MPTHAVELCTCGHELIAHSGTFQLCKHSKNCECIGYTTEGAPKEVEYCVCGHTRVEHTGKFNSCGINGCVCGMYNPGDISGRLQELPKDILMYPQADSLSLQSETPDREELMRTQGHKDDFGKTNWFSMPWDALQKMADVMTFGAEKYHVFNYRNGMKGSRLFSAALRHLWAWWRGEQADPESGISHLAHAMCCIGMLLDLEVIGKLDDDRWKEE